MICAVILLPTLAFRFAVDHANFAYMASTLLRGGWPYVSSWDNQFPGLIFLQAAEMLVFGKSIVMFRLFDVVAQLGNAYLIFRIATRLDGRVAGLIAAVLFCLIYQGYGPWNTAQREGFGMLFVLGGIWWYLTRERRSAVITAAAIGLGFGCAITIKPTLLALALFYAPLIPELRHRQGLKLAGVAAAGLAGPSALVVIGYAAAGALRDLYEACFGYHAIYTVRLRGQDPLLAYWMDKAGRLGLHAVALPFVYAPALFWRAARRERLMIWLGYLGSIYAVFVQGTFAGYHYLPGLALGAILVGSLFSLASGQVLGTTEIRLGSRRAPGALLLAFVLLAGATAVYMRQAPIRHLVTLRFLDRPAPNELRNLNVFDFTESYDVAEYLRERTRPDQAIQIWGFESLVYYLADRPAASRFQTTQPLVMRVPGQELVPMVKRWRAEFVQQMELRQPAYVAVVHQDRWWWAPEERTSDQLLDEFPEWKQIVERDYTPDRTIGRFVIYRRSAGSVR